MSCAHTLARAAKHMYLDGEVKHEHERECITAVMLAVTHEAECFIAVIESLFKVKKEVKQNIVLNTVLCRNQRTAFVCLISNKN